MRRLLGVSLAAILGACVGQSTPESDTEPEPPSNSEPTPPDPDPPSNGNGNDTPEPEVPTPLALALVAWQDTPPSTCGVAGGRTLGWGIDSNRDGVLDTAEVTRQFEVCAGVPGMAGDDAQQGPRGDDGAPGGPGAWTTVEVTDGVNTADCLSPSGASQTVVLTGPESGAPGAAVIVCQ